MVRSMYSGVSGLRSHQTRMDTIGNNIANVNTYGYKSGRTTFRDIYYQTMSTASEPTAAQGGTNPTAVGYGSKVASIDLMMSQSTFTMTDYTMDVAIDGDGFLQVQDQAGNTYYTRAGMLGFDAAGNLVDMQGNFVLGINGDPLGREAASERIQVSLGPVAPTAASVTQTINGVDWTIAATNPTTDGNMNFNFTTDGSLTDGTMKASISTTGIVITMHPDNQYASLAEFNSAVNAAITEANNNQQHPAGNFTISVGAGQDPFAGGPLTADALCSTNFNVKLGSINLGNSYFGGISTTGVVGNTFSANGDATDLECTYINGSPAQFKVTMKVDGMDYVGYVNESASTSGKFNLYNQNGDTTDYIEMSRPSFSTIVDEWNRTYATPGATATGVIQMDAAGVAAGAYTFLGHTVNLSAATANASDTAAAILSQLPSPSATFPYTVVHDGAGNLTVTYREEGSTGNTPPAVDAALNTTWTTAWGGGVDAGTIANGGSGNFTPVALTGVTATPSSASDSVGLSGSSFALRGGTTGGPQTIADMTGIAIASDGTISGLDAAGELVIVGRICLATFANAEGLAQAGSSYFIESANSGEPTLEIPGNGSAGQLVGGTLELSNVDLSREFSDMITTQRGYQANSRIITVSDTMLEELINLKR